MADRTRSRWGSCSPAPARTSSWWTGYCLKVLGAATNAGHLKLIMKDGTIYKNTVGK